MNIIDWIVLGGTLGFIAVYGMWKTRGQKDLDDYLLADKTEKWWTICLSIMATQASAITFLSTPGQAFEDGMRFIQFYFGLPIAMVIISVTAVPLYARLKVFTAYEYLESRFDVKTRTLAAMLFLIQRGLAAGITIYAPSIILSAILGWNLSVTNIFMGGLVVLYTVSGGTKAVSITQKQQMAVMMGGMIVAGFVVAYKLPQQISFTESVSLAGHMNKLNLVDFSFNINDRYNFWSGITGGLFLALSYFGTDQSQVARYLSGKSVTESRLGLLFNGMLKIPMQFIILFIGVLVFVFYQFEKPPVFFNKHLLEQAKQSIYQKDIESLENEHSKLYQQQRTEVDHLLGSIREDNSEQIDAGKQKLAELKARSVQVKDSLKSVISKAVPDAETKDTDYVFITFVLNHMPVGLVGLLLAVIMCAAMSSTASELTALASTTCVDIYKRSLNSKASDKHYVQVSRWLVVLWGVIAIGFALIATLLENLIQAVNILGSLFYGTILGIFLAAFYVKYLKSNAVFMAAIIAEAIVLLLYVNTEISFLWYNVIGCVLVIVIGSLLQAVSGMQKAKD
jgi:Na+/proline symporter